VSNLLPLGWNINVVVVAYFFQVQGKGLPSAISAPPSICANRCSSLPNINSSHTTRKWDPDPGSIVTSMHTNLNFIFLLTSNITRSYVAWRVQRGLALFVPLSCLALTNSTLCIAHNMKGDGMSQVTKCFTFSALLGSQTTNYTYDDDITVQMRSIFFTAISPSIIPQAICSCIADSTQTLYLYVQVRNILILFLDRTPVLWFWLWQKPLPSRDLPPLKTFSLTVATTKNQIITITDSIPVFDADRIILPWA